MSPSGLATVPGRVDYESAALHNGRHADQSCQRLPMPWVWAASARADIGCIRVADTESR